MSWTVDMFNASHDVQTDMTAIETNINHLKDNFASASEPSNLSAGQWWFDTTANILKLRNEANDAWQYVWDFGNNQPMGSVITRGVAAYPGTQLLDAVSLSIGTTDTKVAATGFNFNIAGGAPVNKAATPAGTDLAAGTIPTNKWGIYVFSIDGDGDITVTPGADNFTTGYVDEAAAIAAIPSTPGGTCRMGYVTVLTASGEPFIGGTDALQGGSSGDPSADTNYYVDTPTNTMTADVTPDLSAYSVGVYYIEATYRNYITTPTINMDSIGAKSIKGPDGETLGTGGVILDGHRMILYYDGTDFLLLNPLSSPHGMEVFTSGGTFSKPQGISTVFVRVWGGGGGGGAGYDATRHYRGGHGGYGGYAEGWIEITGDVTVNIGDGGTAGQDGGDSSFAGVTTIEATGGVKGGAAGGSGNGTNGANGSGSGGTLNDRIDWPLLNGSYAYTVNGDGDTVYSGVFSTGTINNYGVGGAGGYYDGSSPVAGASGIEGVVIVYW